MIYLAGKLSGFRMWNMIVAWWYARQLWKAGYSVYSPHLNTGFFTNKTQPYNEWLIDDLAIIDMCESVWFLPNWEKSKGATFEHKYCKLTDKKIRYIELEKRK